VAAYAVGKYHFDISGIRRGENDPPTSAEREDSAGATVSHHRHRVIRHVPAEFIPAGHRLAAYTAF